MNTFHHNHNYFKLIVWDQKDITVEEIGDFMVLQLDATIQY